MEAPPVTCTCWRMFLSPFVSSLNIGLHDYLFLLSSCLDFVHRLRTYVTGEEGAYRLKCLEMQGVQCCLPLFPHIILYNVDWKIVLLAVEMSMYK